MLFLGQTFFKGTDCGNGAEIDLSNMKEITLDNGKYNDLFISKNILKDTLEWDYDTILYAMFKDNLLAGNIEFAIDTITSIRIKQRIKNEFEWQTIFEIPINSVEDLKFIRTYPYAKGNDTTYEFALVPVLNGDIEGNINITECTSSFDGAYLIETNVMLHMFINFELSQQREQDATVVKTVGRAKPFYISNGMSNYDSGQINVTFIQMNPDCQLDIKNGHEYRKYVNDILVDKRPKILKLDDGRMWLIGITDSIPQDSNGNSNMPIHTINWSEIGDCNDQNDMYVNGFIDISVIKGW